MSYSDKIKKFRKDSGFTLRELGVKTGLSYAYLSHLENGARINPSYSTMKKISTALNCKISDIFE